MVADAVLFAFDLDGTVTTREILPCIAAELGLQEELAVLTEMTLKGHIDFEESFRFRFSLLRAIPLETVRQVVASIPLDPCIETFIRMKREQCVIVTGNLDCWVEPLLQRLGCAYYCSRSLISDGAPSLLSVLHKGQAIRDLSERRAPRCIVAIGESVNDIPMFRQSQIGIAYAGVHPPARELLRLADHVVHDAPGLCRLLDELDRKHTSRANAHDA